MRHAYGNAHIHADGDSDTNIHSDCNSDGDGHSHSHIHAYGYSDRYIYAYRNGDSYGYCDSDGNSDRVAAYTDATATAHTAASSLALFRLRELARTNSRVPSLRWIRPPQRDDAKLIREGETTSPVQLIPPQSPRRAGPRFRITEKSRNSRNLY
jgi:hypothetical protein